jgi:hypothetical protein
MNRRCERGLGLKPAKSFRVNAGLRRGTRRSEQRSEYRLQPEALRRLEPPKALGLKPAKSFRVNAGLRRVGALS